jgi:hypothetical protein
VHLARNELDWEYAQEAAYQIPIVPLAREAILGCDETDSRSRRNRPETGPRYQCPAKNGGDNGNLRRPPMTEIVALLLIVLSISVFLAHAFDAYRGRAA